MTVKQAIERAERAEKWDLVLTYATSLGKNWNESELKELFEIIDRKYFSNDQSKIESYLYELSQRCTPKALKQAKKSLKGQMEYLLWQEQKEGKITPEFAKQAKEMLPTFLNNKTIPNAN